MLLAALLMLATVTHADYPREALRRGEEGTVKMRYDVNVEGRVENCVVVQSSGSPTLDHASCENVTRRARYIPATDANGKPIRSHGSRTITWVIPKW
jgi:protein TonB